MAHICVPIGTHIPHAVGFAWGARMKGEKTCALVFFGDGAISEGLFHEGLTLAGVVRAPVVLLCNNTVGPFRLRFQRRAVWHLADKAVGYGIPAIQVDGGDALAVYDAVRQAAERAWGGEGPTFIEALTYRMAPHGPPTSRRFTWMPSVSKRNANASALPAMSNIFGNLACSTRARPRTCMTFTTPRPARRWVP